jgi:hypothetical protein
MAIPYACKTEDLHRRRANLAMLSARSTFAWHRPGLGRPIPGDHQDTTSSNRYTSTLNITCYLPRPGELVAGSPEACSHRENVLTEIDLILGPGTVCNWCHINIIAPQMQRHTSHRRALWANDLSTGGTLPKLHSPTSNLGPRRYYETATLYRLTSSAAQFALQHHLQSANLTIATVRSLTAEALHTVALVLGECLASPTSAT